MSYSKGWFICTKIQSLGLLDTGSLQSIIEFSSNMSTLKQNLGRINEPLFILNAEQNCHNINY